MHLVCYLMRNLRVFGWLLLLAGTVAACPTDGTGLHDKRKLIAFLTAALLASAPQAFGLDNGPPSLKKRKSSPGPHRNRSRKKVVDIMDELGPCCVRRACRMTEASFRALVSLLEPHGQATNARLKKTAKSGLIPFEIRVSAALRHFAGVRPEDICLAHGISHTEVFNSVWIVVDAVNSCKELAFSHPSSHEEQQQIAEGFKAKSDPKFSTCAGAIDCMLTWIEKPTDMNCAEAKMGAKKWFCGRKKKFGICPQGTVGVNGKFLDVCVEHPASTSDFPAFTASPLCHQLVQRNFINRGLALFGDNACVNCRHMATPCRASASGAKEDDCNFFHSQASK